MRNVKWDMPKEVDLPTKEDRFRWLRGVHPLAIEGSAYWRARQLLTAEHDSPKSG